MDNEEWYRRMKDRRNFEDEAYQEATREHPVGSWVYIMRTRQFVIVAEVTPSADGPLIRVEGMGFVPVDDVRKPSEEELAEYLRKRGG